MPCYAVHRLPSNEQTVLSRVPMERITVIRGQQASSYELSASDVRAPAGSAAVIVVSGVGRALSAAADVTYLLTYLPTYLPTYLLT